MKVLMLALYCVTASIGLASYPACAAPQDQAAPTEAADTVDDIPTEAKILFRDYVRANKKFAPELLALYSEDADIQRWRLDRKTGKLIKLKYSVAQQRVVYLEAIQQMISMKAQVKFKNVKLELENPGVRITADLQTVLWPQGSITGQISLLIMPDAMGRWQVEQEIIYYNEMNQ